MATLLINLFTPAHLVIGLLVVVGTASDPSPLRGGLAWGALGGTRRRRLPYAWVLHAIRRGRFTSRHIPDRAQHMLPLASPRPLSSPTWSQS